MFWWALYATPAVWLLLAFVALFRFNIEYLLIVVARPLSCNSALRRSDSLLA